MDSQRASRFRRAWSEASPGWGIRLGIAGTGGALAILGGLQRGVRGTALGNIAIGVGCTLGGLLLAFAYTFLRCYWLVGCEMKTERATLDELRRVISDDVRLHGPQGINLDGLLEAAGVTFKQEHVTALKTLNAGGEVRIIRILAGHDADSGDRILSAMFHSLRVLDGRESDVAANADD